METSFINSNRSFINSNRKKLKARREVLTKSVDEMDEERQNRLDALNKVEEKQRRIRREIEVIDRTLVDLDHVEHNLNNNLKHLAQE